LLGHLAAYEMTSTGPNRPYGNGARRLGGDADATAFYDEHVEADAVHEQIAVAAAVGGMAVPALVRSVKLPRNSKGPSGYGVRTAPCSSAMRPTLPAR
jgi:hypothetical protein